ncbi:TauD/TfdA dioxygenase family protein [Rhodococcus phenolicus]|uniref:TauD/TfdA dioxygenase family protein n=1 Tax=Rhodococcus phenolicus TaxID=263849 RepID=UPI000836F4B5|nr:TauD/TfdA family dioxygenase [Rhodococcus phenolicus]
MTTLEHPATTIVPLAGNIGAEVRGLRLDTLTDTDVASIRSELYRHGVLFFPGQGTDPATHRAFAQHFGEIVYPHQHLANLGAEGYPEISVIGTDNGSAYQANRWHCDVAWRAEPSRYSILHMQVLPEAGGDTLWSNQYAALDALSTPIREALYGLTATHRIGPVPNAPEASHPLVIRHPDTGREALFVNDLFTERIDGLSDDESRALLGLLKSVSIRPEFTVRRRWAVGDIAIWDNHFVQHNAIYDYGDAARRIHRIEAAPEAPIPAR